MKEVILLKNGEIALKGLNRRTFEDQLIKNLRRRLSPFGTWQITAAQSTVTAIPAEDGTDMDAAADACARVFGFVGYSKALMVDKDMDVIRSVTGDYLAAELAGARTFKVCAKRADKKFPFTSPELKSGPMPLGKK